MLRTATLMSCRIGAAASSERLGWIQGKSYTNTLPYSMPPAFFSSSTQRSKYNLSNDDIVKWRFPADARMEDMIKQVHYKIVSCATIITFNSVSSISPRLMEEALNILYDKVESLRVCYRLRQNRMWVADMPHRVLDFQTLNECDAEEQLLKLIESQFDMNNGPLWKARLIIPSPNASCQFPEVKKKFPYQYDLVLSLHHGINDGGVVRHVTELLLSIIDHLLQDLPVDIRQSGELRDGVEARKEEIRIKAALENDPVRSKQLLKEYVNARHFPLLIEAFGDVSDGQQCTGIFPIVLIDNEIMGKISMKCRCLGITINACMTAAFNAALVEAAREAGIDRRTYNITSRHPVDGRRLMRGGTEPYLGYHNIPITQVAITPKNVKRNFWEYARNLDSELRDKLNRNVMCEERVLKNKLESAGYTPETHYSQPLPLYYDYLFSNLYSPQYSTQCAGKLVQITSTVMHMHVHKAYYPITIGIMGLRDQVEISAVWSLATISRKSVGKYLDKVISVLHDITM